MNPLLPYFLSYLGGLLAAIPQAVHFFFPYLLPVLVAGSGFFIFSRIKKPSFWRWALLILCLSWGYLSPSLSEKPLPSNHILNHIDESRRTTVMGTLVETPQFADKKVFFHMDISQIQSGKTPVKVTGRAHLTHYQPERIQETFHAGDIIQFSQVRLKRPRNFKNPGAFDYQGYLKARGISVIGSLSKNSSIEKLGVFPLPFFKALQVALRGHLLRTLETHFSGEEAALLKAMLLGQKSALSDEIKEAYIATGLSHLMAVSGLHVGFVAWAAFILFWPLAFHGLLKYHSEWAQSGAARKIAAFLCLFPVLFYLLLVGPKITALRAGFLVIVFLFAIIANRERNLFNALLIAAFLILIWNPEAILNVSFQLSFAAMAGILFVVQHVARPPDDPIDRMGEQPWFRRFLRGVPFEEENEGSPLQQYSQSLKKYLSISALISLAVYLTTLPFLIFHFNHVSLIGIFLNLIMVPLASVLIPLALFAISLGGVFPALGWILSWPLHWLLKCFLVIPQFFSSFPYASVYVPSPPRMWVLLYFSVLTGGAWLLIKMPAPLKDPSSPLNFRWEFLRKSGLVFASLATVAWLIWPRFPERPSETLQVSILDVGQGESIFIEFPNRETMMLDGGGFYKNSLDVGKAVVAPFLWNRGIGHIDYLAATHSDQDHIGGLESLVDLFSIGHFLDGFAGMNDSRIENLRQKTLAKQAVQVSLQSGTPLNFGEVRIVPLHPNPQFIHQMAGKKRNKAGNELSLVLRLEYRNFSLLLTGDIGKSTEEYLMERALPLQATFLKSPHHGSRFSNSPSFIRTVQPQSVIFSSGYLNWMRHPHPEVVERYQAAGTQIWRTDLMGSVHITTDGFKHQIHHFSEKR
ncbi:MAG: DNA internalization-related competence protein ComEC/Rec2 [Nitrospinaceae bacterium]|nr:MAG: DNA internalization-related competence protein ComEC/Rec2 [Nitrospinaceae bacterium]